MSKLTGFLLSLCVVAETVGQVNPSAINPGTGLPIWSLPVSNSVLSLNWIDGRVTQLTRRIPGQRNDAVSGVALDSCGRPAFYVVHTGAPGHNQLHIYSASGERKTNDIPGDRARGLNALNLRTELQVIPVPGRNHEWFIVYSDSRQPGRVAYSRIGYDGQSNIFNVVLRDAQISPDTFIHGKAVSRKRYDNDVGPYHLLMLVKQNITNANLRISRFKITAQGIASYSEDEVVGSFLPDTLGSVELNEENMKLAVVSARREVYLINVDDGLKPVTGLIIAMGSPESQIRKIEFSPDGKYIYACVGKDLIQIDPASPADPVVDQWNFKKQDVMSIESAFDGRVYFTLENSKELHAILFPNSPLGKQNTRSYSRKRVNANILYMPEGIDGGQYLTELSPSTYTVAETISHMDVTLVVEKDGTLDKGTVIVFWGDGTQDRSLTHRYPVAGDYRIRVLGEDDGGCSYWFRGIPVTVGECPEPPVLSIINTALLNCNTFSVRTGEECAISSYRWNFGDGTAESTLAEPVHAFPTGGSDSYTVQVVITFTCSGCPYNSSIQLEVDKRIRPEHKAPDTIETCPEIKSGILAVSTNSFSDGGLLQQPPGKLSKNDFLNGKRGVWRSSGNFVYKTDRNQSTPIDIARDGDYDMMQFVWPLAGLKQPNWIRSQLVTQYSAYGYGIESQDVLGVYSSAIYDYGGQLQTASSVNARNEEIAFTGFEVMENSIAGNWIFGDNAITVPITVEVKDGYMNQGTVRLPVNQIPTNVEIQVDEVFAEVVCNTKTEEAYHDSSFKVVCTTPDPIHPEFTTFCLNRNPVGEGMHWTGKMRFNVVKTNTAKARVDRQGHTGKMSLVIEADTEYKQFLVKLEPGKDYLINLWASIGGNGVSSLAQQLNDDKGVGIRIVYYNDQNQPVGNNKILSPSGYVIEGWRQITGSIQSPPGAAYFSVTFKKPDGANLKAYYDDLRLQPMNANMKTFVYNVSDYKLTAILDDENFASLFFYDQEGNLYLTKKETEKGIMTISENISYLKQGKP